MSFPLLPAARVDVDRCFVQFLVVLVFCSICVSIWTFVLWWNARMHDDSSNVILCLCLVRFLLT
jgi:hypothetical protein